MRRLIRLLFGLSVLVVLPTLAISQNTEAKKPAEVDPKKQQEDKYRAKLFAAPFFVGKLTAIKTEGEEKRFTVEVPFQIRTPNPDGVKKYNEVLGQFRVAYARGNRDEAQRLYNELTVAYAGAFDIEDRPLTFELKAGGDLKVRKALPPPKEPGDDGVVRPYTAKELAALKGSPTLPGFTAGLDELMADSFVAVYLDKAKLRAAATKTAKDKEAEPTEPEMMVYPITMLAIVPAPADMPAGNPFGGGGNPFK